MQDAHGEPLGGDGSGSQPSRLAATPILGHTFSQISRLGPQPKLTVNEPGDKYEQEETPWRIRSCGWVRCPPFNAKAARTTRNEERRRGTPQRSSPSALIRRAGDGLAQVADVSGVVEEGLAGGGQPLDLQTRAFMEPRFGHDFSHGRLHTDARASQSCEQVAARAYTVGTDIAFRSGDYNPGTGDGRRLLAHELTHVTQQGAAPESAKRRSVVSNAVTQVMRDDPAPTTAAPAPATPAAAEPDPAEIWRQIETRATPELLIKLQEIGRAAGEQTKGQINEVFSPYE